VSTRNGMHSLATVHPLSIEAKCRIRDELHSVQVGLNLLRQEMLAGDLDGADLTYATIEHCLSRLAEDELFCTSSELPELSASC